MEEKPIDEGLTFVVQSRSCTTPAVVNVGQDRCARGGRGYEAHRVHGHFAEDPVVADLLAVGHAPLVGGDDVRVGVAGGGAVSGTSARQAAARAAGPAVRRITAVKAGLAEGRAVEVAEHARRALAVGALRADVAHDLRRGPVDGRQRRQRAPDHRLRQAAAFVRGCVPGGERAVRCGSGAGRFLWATARPREQHRLSSSRDEAQRSTEPATHERTNGRGLLAYVLYVVAEEERVRPRTR